MTHKGTNILAIKKELGSELLKLEEIASDWTLIKPAEFQYESRWFNHWRKILRHDNGLLIAIDYAIDLGDCSLMHPIECREVEAFQETVTVYRERPGSHSPRTHWSKRRKTTIKISSR